MLRKISALGMSLSLCVASTIMGCAAESAEVSSTATSGDAQRDGADVESAVGLGRWGIASYERGARGEVVLRDAAGSVKGRVVVSEHAGTTSADVTVGAVKTRAVWDAVHFEVRNDTTVVSARRGVPAEAAAASKALVDAGLEQTVDMALYFAPLLALDVSRAGPGQIQPRWFGGSCYEAWGYALGNSCATACGRACDLNSPSANNGGSCAGDDTTCTQGNLWTSCKASRGDCSGGDQYLELELYAY